MHAPIEDDVMMTSSLYIIHAYLMVELHVHEEAVHVRPQQVCTNQMGES